MNIFHVLFYVSKLQKVSIAGMGGWINGLWSWGDFRVNKGELVNSV